MRPNHKNLTIGFTHESNWIDKIQEEKIEITQKQARKWHTSEEKRPHNWQIN